MNGLTEIMSPAQQQAFSIEIQHDAKIMINILKKSDPQSRSEE
jgi:hypothetical protein